VTTRGWLYAGDGTLRGVWRLLAFAAAVFVCAQLAQAFLYPLFAAASGVAGRPLRAFPWLDCLAVLAATQVVLRVCERRGWAFVAMGRARRPAALAPGSPWARSRSACRARCSSRSAGCGSRRARRSWWGAAGLARRVPRAGGAVRGTAGARLRVRGAAESAGTAWACGSRACCSRCRTRAIPGADAQSLLVVTLAGVFLAAVVVRCRACTPRGPRTSPGTGRMAALFHTKVSGLAFRDARLPRDRRRSRLADGGAWGPEGWLAAAAGLAAALSTSVARGRRPQDADPIARPLTPRGDLA
jgi:hypothetical protein